MLRLIFMAETPVEKRRSLSKKVTNLHNGCDVKIAVDAGQALPGIPSPLRRAKKITEPRARLGRAIFSSDDWSA
ncbi:hypothetical protein [Bradyrhizobium sp.]|uniref:hypothetical protein n=1 Tax=Bradyrhizobium sp. TaxID=376 RepID=UPI0025B7D5CA|nr:hypothetical protein [Bradyrhizobium sp.]